MRYRNPPWEVGKLRGAAGKPGGSLQAAFARPIHLVWSLSNWASDHGTSGAEYLKRADATDCMAPTIWSRL